MEGSGRCVGRQVEREWGVVVRRAPLSGVWRGGRVSASVLFC